MENYTELQEIINGLYLSNYESHDSYQNGYKAAHQFFADNGFDGDVTIDEIKEIKTFNDASNTTVTTHIYECYVDSGSVDYFHFSYETEF